MRNNITKQKIVKEFAFVEHNNTLCICVDGFNMEAGFSVECSAEEKMNFYKGVKDFTDCFRKIAGILNEEIVYIGSCFNNVNNYYNWKDIKCFDAYNNLRCLLKPDEVKKIGVDEFLVDLVIECNFRYFSQIVFFFPNSHIFVRPDVHCWFELFGETTRLKNICNLLKVNCNEKIILSMENLSEKT